MAFLEPENMPQLILLTIVFVLFLIFLYIKLAYPFWNVQPVFHPYDFWRGWSRHPFRIHPRFHPAIKTKYTKPDIVKTIPFVNCSLDEKKAFVNLVQCYSLANEDVMYMFHLENLEAYFGGHMYASYLSFYREIFYTVKKENIVNGGLGSDRSLTSPGYGEGEGEETRIVREMIPRGCISSRSGILSVGSGSLVEGYPGGAFGATREPIYYIDFMTTVRGLPNDIAIHREMFDTHMYNVGLAEWRDEISTKMETRKRAIGIGLFKRVGVELAGIVPFVQVVRRVYEIPNNPGFFKGIRYPEHVVLTEISAANIRKMTDGLERGLTKFAIYGHTDMSNLVGLVKAGILYVYVLERLGEILAMYFFKDTRIQMDDVGGVLELAASIYMGGSVDLFREGFKGSVGCVLKKNSVYRRLYMDDISDNGGLNMADWYWLGAEKGAYYLFNFVAAGFINGPAFFIF